MAKPLTTYDSNRRVFTNLKYLYFGVWADESTAPTEYIDLVNIVGDSTTVEQAENEVNELSHEFSSEPLFENINLGKKTFTTECIDFQNPVLKALFGWEIDEAGNAYAPVTYKDLYCTIEMGFNTTEDVIVLPKVKLNSRAVLSSMKTDASRGNISGTCYSAYVTSGSMTAETDMAVIAEANVDTYTVAASGTSTGE